MRPEQRLAAASRLVSTRSRPDEAAGTRFLRDAAATGIPLDHFWIWESPAGEAEAAVLAIPNPGRTALCYASHPIGLWRAARIVACLDAGGEVLAEEGIVLLQALLEPSERAERKVFNRAGFETIAQLAYLQRSLNDAGDFPPTVWPPGVITERYNAASHAGFLEALTASYEDSLDCPALTGVRSADEILAGHRATGEFDPALWTLLRVDGMPGGVLLLNPSPRQGTVELVYLGLAKAARGRGLGRLLLAHGLHCVRSRRERAMTLAVDEENAPAIRLYRRFGFRRVLRRIAMVRDLREGRGAR